MTKRYSVVFGIGLDRFECDTIQEARTVLIERVVHGQIVHPTSDAVYDYDSDSWSRYDCDSGMVYHVAESTVELESLFDEAQSNPTGWDVVETDCPND